MGGAALGAPGEQIQEDEEEVGVPTSDEPDAELRGPPPQPEGLREKGSYAALSGLHGGPAPRCALRLASKPFSLNAAPSAYMVTLLDHLPRKSRREVLETAPGREDVPQLSLPARIEFTTAAISSAVTGL